MMFCGIFDFDGMIHTCVHAVACCGGKQLWILAPQHIYSTAY
jgi:hypothetical protein